MGSQPVILNGEGVSIAERFWACVTTATLVVWALANSLERAQLLSDIGARDVTARVTMVPDINERALNSRVA